VGYGDVRVGLRSCWSRVTQLSKSDYGAEVGYRTVGVDYETVGVGLRSCRCGLWRCQIRVT
jgi:hypothetical protein